MMLNIFMYKNEVLGTFSNPMFVDHEPGSIATELQRQMVIQGKRDLKGIQQYEDVTLYQVGVFDDETGVITNIEPFLVLDCRTVFKDVLERFHTKEGVA